MRSFSLEQQEQKQEQTDWLEMEDLAGKAV
jgi:hypothetical protein